MNKKRNLIGRLRVKEPRDTAAGVASVKNSVRIAARKMGFKRGMKALSALNQQGGIDCQSCAWPDPLKRTRAEFCENGVKALADEATTKLIDDKFFADRTVGELLTYSEHWLNEQGRLTRPMVLREGAENFEPLTWEEAFRTISRELNALPSPDDAAFYTSGRTSNEAAFLYQLFVRQFGTNNFPDCSNMCHESTSVALTETIGLGKATVRLEDLESAGLIIVMGQNPGTNAPRMMTSLKRAKL
ncbi:MAG: molybdopterin-dependent oxidoreductase, partial [Acidobacteriota bacterium]